MGFLVYLPSVVAAVRSGFVGLAVLDTVAVAVVIALHRADRLPFAWRASMFCLVCYVFAAGLLVVVGPISPKSTPGTAVGTS